MAGGRLARTFFPNTWRRIALGVASYSGSPHDYWLPDKLRRFRLKDKKVVAQPNSSLEHSKSFYGKKWQCQFPRRCHLTTHGESLEFLRYSFFKWMNSFKNCDLGLNRCTILMRTLLVLALHYYDLILDLKKKGVGDVYFSAKNSRPTCARIIAAIAL